MLGTFLKSVVGVAVGIVVNWAIAKANLGALTLGTVSISYSQLITIVALTAGAYALKSKGTVSQIMAVGGASQLVLMVLKLVGMVV